jgi:hydroxysqualene dehydroxylase
VSRVVVLGGGLAGIVAALDCADAGAQVTLVEVRPRLGGAAYSVQRDGLTIDNGQHVFLRCCASYRALLRRLGSSHLTHVQPRLRIALLERDGRRKELARSDLPAPLHLARALLSYGPLSVRQRLSAALAVAAISRLDPSDPAIDAQNLGAWLGKHRQSQEAIQALWDLIALPTLNVPAREASLALGAFVFQEGLLSSAAAGDVGLHRAPLSTIIGEPAKVALTQAGVDVRLRWRARSITPCAEGLEVAGGSGSQSQTLACEAVIVALPHLRAAELLPAQASELARRLRGIGISPIVNLHVLYDREVLDLPFAASVESPVQYVFDRTDAGGAPPGSQYLAVSLSGAVDDMRRSVDELRARYLPAIQTLLPRARQAKTLGFLVTREHAATFKAAPGVNALRPGPRTPVRGLTLAGAYTDTGWPATLESAVISGHAAAKATLAELQGASDAPVGAEVLA